MTADDRYVLLSLGRLRVYHIAQIISVGECPHRDPVANLAVLCDGGGWQIHGHPFGRPIADMEGRDDICRACLAAYHRTDTAPADDGGLLDLLPREDH